MKSLPSIGLLLLCSIVVSRAQTLIDFDVKASYNPSADQTGEAVLGLTSGDTWNAVGLADDNSIVDSTNTRTSITYSSPLASTASTYPDGGGTAMDTATKPLMTDYMDTANQFGLEVKLGGLSAYAGDSFTLVLYGSGDTASQGDAFSLTSGATGGNTANTLETTGANREISQGIGDAYQTFTGALTGEDLDIAIGANGSQYSVLNGFQLEISTPEPGTWSLLLGGLAGLWAIVLRRRMQV